MASNLDSRELESPGKWSHADKEQVLEATARLIVEAVVSQEQSAPDNGLEMLANGVFVCLKRGGHLRSCCGGLGEQALPVSELLQHAARKTVKDDPRFPPISPTELDHLEVELWLLHDPLPVLEQGENRLGAIELTGRHGLAIRRGRQHGLFLPSVPIDHGWDARTFVERLCIKAGLEPHYWQDDVTQLTSFQGEMVRGRIDELLGLGQSQPPAALLTPEQLAEWADYCRARLSALVGRMSVPTPNFPSDLTVTGFILTLRHPLFETPWSHAQVSLRPGLDLLPCLDRITNRVATQLLRQRGQLDVQDDLAVGLTLFHDPAMHGTLSSPHLDGFDPKKRAMLVCAGQRKGIVHLPEATTEEVLDWSSRWASNAASSLYGMEVLGAGNRLAVSVTPRRLPGNKVRPPAVAGRFYPADPQALGRLVDDLLAEPLDIADSNTLQEISAALVPHAGLAYSGRVAARVFRRLAIPRSVIIIGPKHTSLGARWAIAPHRSWAIPGKTLESEVMLARRMARGISGLSVDHEAHQQEHAIEVELPFLARLAPRTRIAGVVIGRCALESCLEFAGQLADVLRTLDEPPLLLISSDMNHFATDAENRRRDELAMSALENLDPVALYHTVRDNDISMCGVLPAVIALETLRLLGRIDKAVRVAYATSGEVTGNLARVVGYAGMLFGLKEPRTK